MAEQGFGGLAPYHPSWRERIGNAIYDIARMGGLGSIAHRMRKEGGFAADFVPGLGDALAVDDAKRDYDAGNYGMAVAGLGLAALGLVPGVGDVAAKGVKKGIRAFHGSPHDFDKFDLSKIGTGEGAQAYGHGLYFAENKDVADAYKTSVTRNMDQLRDIAKSHGLTGDAAEMLAHQFSNGFGGKSFNEWMDGSLRSAIEDPLISARTKAAAQQILNRSVEASDAYAKMKTPGRMYEVNINADPDDFLDWDKPLSEQPRAREAFEKLGLPTHYDNRWYGPQKPGNGPIHWTNNGYFIRKTKRGYEYGYGSPWDSPAAGKAKTLEEAQSASGVTPRPLDGRDAVRRAEDVIGERNVRPSAPNGVYSREEQAAAHLSAVRALREAGIPGIKYLDQGSRAAGDGSRNYVVFDDALIEIVRKYGLAGAVAAGLISQEMAQQMQAQGMGEL